MYPAVAPQQCCYMLVQLTLREVIGERIYAEIGVGIVTDSQKVLEFVVFCWHYLSDCIRSRQGKAEFSNTDVNDSKRIELQLQ